MLDPEEKASIQTAASRRRTGGQLLRVYTIFKLSYRIVGSLALDAKDSRYARATLIAVFNPILLMALLCFLLLILFFLEGKRGSDIALDE